MLFSRPMLRVAFLVFGICAMGNAQTKIKGSDVAINGESFFAAANITSELTRHAKADGYIGSSESFRQIAVSGAVMTGILNQYKNCTPKPVYVIGDGGGNDLMGSCGGTATPECAAIKAALNTVKQYFEEMKNSGTKKVIWMRYPDPQGGSWATLKTNQDVYNPEVEKICKASVLPKCLWIDLRPVWEGHYTQFTTDGIHPTTAGGTATAEAFWKFAKENSFFDLSSTSVSHSPESFAPSIRGHRIANRSLILTISLNQSLPVTLRLMTLTGKIQVQIKNQGKAGVSDEAFSLGSAPSGLYRMEVQLGTVTKQSTLFLP